jgi:hypothetical protein
LAGYIAPLLTVREEQYRRFQMRDLRDGDYVYHPGRWVHFSVRPEDDRLCTLVMIWRSAECDSESTERLERMILRGSGGSGFACHSSRENCQHVLRACQHS